jgi:hypothetical protein
MEVSLSGALVIVREAALEVPPPGAGVTTATWKTCALAWSATEREVVSWVLLTKVVGRVTPSSCITEDAANPLPVTVMGNASVPPLATAEGETEIEPGAEFTTENVAADEAPPPGVGLNAVIASEPRLARSAVVRDMVARVALVKVVDRAAPFTRTTVPPMNPVPATVTLVAPDPTTAVEGFIPAMVGRGFSTASVTVELDAVEPESLTVMFSVAPVANCPAAIAAVTWVALR